MTIQLDSEEQQLIDIDPFDIENKDKSILARLLTKIDKTDPRYVNLQIMDAILFERNMLMPHYEKGMRFAKVASLASGYDLNCSRLWSIAATHLQANGLHNRAAEQFEIAATHAKTEGVETIKISKLYRDAKTCYMAGGDDTGARRSHINEFDTKLEAATHPNKIVLWIYKLLCLYGESPLRVAISAIVVITACAMAYWFLGINDGEKPVHSIATSFYFSVVTFTTLGYGDYSPMPGIARLISSIEAITGLFLTSLFLVTFVRRFTR